MGLIRFFFCAWLVVDHAWVVSKETYYSVKRDLLQCQKRPTTCLTGCRPRLSSARFESRFPPCAKSPVVPKKKNEFKLLSVQSCGTKNEFKWLSVQKFSNKWAPYHVYYYIKALWRRRKHFLELVPAGATRTRRLIRFFFILSDFFFALFRTCACRRHSYTAPSMPAETRLRYAQVSKEA
jgi:hypothetical protein